jgi:hypothetical protein
MQRKKRLAEAQRSRFTHPKPDGWLADDIHPQLPSVDSAPFVALCAEFDREQAAREKLLGEQIAMGWGDTPSSRIPADWRTRRGVESGLSPEHREKISKKRQAAEAEKKRVAGTVSLCQTDFR